MRLRRPASDTVPSSADVSSSRRPGRYSMASRPRVSQPRRRRAHGHEPVEESPAQRFSDRCRCDAFPATVQNAAHLPVGLHFGEEYNHGRPRCGPQGPTQTRRGKLPAPPTYIARFFRKARLRPMHALGRDSNRSGRQRGIPVRRRSQKTRQHMAITEPRCQNRQDKNEGIPANDR